MADRQGVDLADALKAYGKNVADIARLPIGRAKRAPMWRCISSRARVLEAERQPLGVVTGIVGQSRLRVTVTGEAGHAGTVPMKLRRDALAGAAEMILHGGAPGARRSERGWWRPSAASTCCRARPISSRRPRLSPSTCATWTTRRGRRRLPSIRQQSRAIAEARHLAVIFEPSTRRRRSPATRALQDQFAAAIGELGHRAINCRPAPATTAGDGEALPGRA